jgi:putative membrane protein
VINNSHMMNGWGYPLMAASTLAFWTLVVLIAIATRVYLGAGRSERHAASTPDQVLANRFAHGDIDQDEYVRGQAALSAHLRRTVSDSTR